MTALQAEVDALWARTGCGPAGRLLSARTRHEAHWYVEVAGDLARFVQWERGHGEPLTGWLTLPEAALWVLKGRAARVAQAEEMRERGMGRYSRWNWMAPAIALMERISPEHGAALAKDYGEVLAYAPLDDEERQAARWSLPAQPHRT